MNSTGVSASIIGGGPQAYAQPSPSKFRRRNSDETTSWTKPLAPVQPASSEACDRTGVKVISGWADVIAAN